MNRRTLAPGIALVAALLAGVTLLVFSPIRRAAFIGFDDNEYIVDNPQVQAGLTLRGSGWAWTTTHAGNWHPLTWLSLMLDAQLFGTWPGGYHLGNLLLHLANTLLLFALLRRLTRALATKIQGADEFRQAAAEAEEYNTYLRTAQVISTVGHGAASVLWGPYASILAAAVYGAAGTMNFDQTPGQFVGNALLASPDLNDLKAVVGRKIEPTAAAKTLRAAVAKVEGRKALILALAITDDIKKDLEALRIYERIESDFIDRQLDPDGFVPPTTDESKGGES